MGRPETGMGMVGRWAVCKAPRLYEVTKRMMIGRKVNRFLLSPREMRRISKGD